MPISGSADCWRESFYLGPRERLGTAAVQCLNIGELRVEFHLKRPLPRETAFLFGIECARLACPLGCAKTRGRRGRATDWRSSLSSARSRTRVRTLMHVLRSESVTPAKSS